MALLEMQDIVKSYDGKTRAVDRLSLNLDSGSVCALLGKNGAGKTTIEDLALIYIIQYSAYVVL